VNAAGATDRAVVALLWRRFLWRHWCREPGLTALLVGVLALGVAVFLAVRLANKAAVSGFGFFTESLAGESDFIVRPQSGNLSAADLAGLRNSVGTWPVAIFPVLEASAALASAPDTTLLRLVGADLVALGNAAAGFAKVGGPPEEGAGATPQLLGRADQVFVGESFLRRWGLSPEEPLRLVVGTGIVEVQIAAVIPDDPTRPSVPDQLVLFDLPGLQRVLGNPLAISRIELRLPEGRRAEIVRGEVAAAVKEWAAVNNAVVETPADRKNSVTQMSAAFRMNLGILSCLALLVGTYLILQAMEAAVVKRRGEIAILRSLGITPRQVRMAWLIEAAVLGLVGAALGVLLGRLLAVGTVAAIAQSVNTLYYETTTAAVTLTMAEAVFALAFGLSASLVAGLLPAREAALTPPAQAMRQGTQGGGLALLRMRWLGWVLIASGALAALAPPWLGDHGAVPVGGYLAAALVVLGGSILVGALFRPVAALLRVPLRSLRHGAGPMRRYAASQLQRPAGRHRLTAAGLAVAIGMAAAMGILVASFERTLTGWIEQLLKADLYVAAAGTSSVANENMIPAGTWEALGATPGVAGLDLLRRYQLTAEGRDFFLGGSQQHDDPSRHLELIWKEAPADDGPLALSMLREGRVPAWVSDSFARQFACRRGDDFSVPTPVGPQLVRIAGVYAEYGGEIGTMMVGRGFTSDWFQDDAVNQLAIYAEGGTDPAAIDALEARISNAFPHLVVRSNARLREESIRIFHQTFAVTYALEAIAVFIAVAGLGLALAGLLLERKEELATLREMGATRREIAAAAVWEGLGLVTAGVSGGLAMSFLLGAILIYVINPQSFGWTLGYTVPWGSFVALAGITAVTAGIVAAGVGRRFAQLRSDRTE